MASTTVRIATITFANGADTIDMFTPVLRTLHPAGLLLTTVLFLALVGVRCGLGTQLGGHRTVVAAPGRVAHRLVPVVCIAVGVLILPTNGTLAATRQTLSRRKPWSLYPGAITSRQRDDDDFRVSNQGITIYELRSRVGVGAGRGGCNTRGLVVTPRLCPASEASIDSRRIRHPGWRR